MKLSISSTRVPAVSGGCGRRRATSVVLTGAVLTALTGCVTSSGGGAEPQAASSPASTDLTDEEVELTVTYADDPPTEDLVEAFEQEHPNISVTTQLVPFSDYIKSIRLTMSSDDAPDIAQYNPGAMHSLIPAGLIRNLDPYAEAYGWADSFPETTLATLRSDEEAKEYGTGSLYAVPGALSVLGVYYNKGLLESAGVTQAPSTLDELESALQAVSDAGATPFVVGAQTIGGFQMWNALTNVLGDPEDYRNWVYGKSGATIETDGALAAAQKIVEWNEKGFIPPSANGTADSDALATFTNGGAAFYVSGSWSASAIEEALGEDAGFFAMPAEDPSTPLAASGSAVSFSISAKTEHPDEAAAFLDFLSTEQAAPIQFDGGFLPVDTDVPLDSSGVRKDTVEDFARINDGAGIAPFPDFAAPGMIDVLTASSQGLLTGQVSPQEYVASLQTEWASYHEQ